MYKFASTCNEKFFEGLLCFVYSIKKHNDFNFKYYVIDEDLSEKSKVRLKNLHSNVEFIKPHFEKYENLNTKTPKHLIPSLYKIECFRINEDQLMICDTDLLCLGNISHLFSFKEDFSVNNLMNENKKEIYQVNDNRPDFSAGIMIARNKYLGENIVDEIISYIGKPESEYHPYGDQPVLNTFFRNKQVRYFDRKWHAYKRYFSDNKNHFKIPGKNVNERIKCFDPKIIHYAGIKPWLGQDNSDDTYHHIEKIWKKYYLEINE